MSSPVVRRRTADPVSSGNGPTIATEDEDSKVGKVQTAEQRRTTFVLGLLGFLCFLFLIGMVKLNHNRSYRGPYSLRRQQEEKSNQQQANAALFLPPQSIYRVSVENGEGEMTSLEQFAGKVSLVVNVASQ
jgi:hypothetical protein